MALQASGSISFSQIGNEFGYPSRKNLGAYRVSETYGQLINIPLDSGIPQSGTIKFSDFYSKKLNMIVDFYSTSTPTNGNDAKNRYNRTDDNFVKIVGGFISRPANTSGKKIIVHVNRIIGSTKGNINYCALKTGSWNANTELILNVSSSGRIIGAGGDGGNGGGGNGGNGTQGTSALGIQYPLTLINNGNIIHGTSGGGGGGGAKGFKHANTQKGCDGRQDNASTMSGGGGGGGRGFPGGNGGGVSGSTNGRTAQRGQNGLISDNGAGGAGAAVSDGELGNCWGAAIGGSGGNGGFAGQSGQGSSTSYSNGVAGDLGYSIIISPSGSLISSSGSGSLVGPILTGTEPA